jgi:hypothetical protein
MQEQAKVTSYLKRVEAISLAEKEGLDSQIEDLIDLLDDKSVQDLLSVVGGDYEKLLEILAEETNNVVNLKQFDKSLTTCTIQGLPHLQEGFEVYLRKKNLAYFTFSCLPDFELAYHTLEWFSMIQLYQKLNVIAARDHSKSYVFSFAVPLWRLYRYTKPDGFSVLPDDIKFYREGMIITNEYKLAKKLLKKVKEEIKFNPVLSKALYPQGDEGNWASESIACKNGAEITLSSYRTSNRGPHPGWITVDDFLDRSAMYSKDQRESFKESFNAEIMNMILPQGTIDVVGTPFHEKDLYSDLKMDPNWRVFEYPAVFPDGSVLWANRYSFEALKAKRLSLGPLIFSREILVRPISDSTSIFPWSLLEKAFLGMKDYCLVKNRASFPIKFRKVAIGVDWALSATVAADFTEMTVLGEDFQGHLWLLEERSLHGAGYNQQIAELQALNVAYSADVIMVEVNGFQKVMSGLATEAGLTNIVEETTTGHTKKDFYEGLPAIAVLFEQGKMHFPRGDEYSIEKTNEICSQLNSMAFDEDRGTLESVGTHDDKAMSLYFAVKGIKSVNGIFRVGSTL